MTFIHSGPYSVDVRRRTIPKGGAPIMLDGEPTGLYVTYITEFSMERKGPRRVQNLRMTSLRVRSLKRTSFLTLTYAEVDTGINHGTSARDVVRAIRHDYDSTLHFRLGQGGLCSKLERVEDIESLVKLCRSVAIHVGCGFLFGRKATWKISSLSRPLMNSVNHEGLSLPFLDSELALLNESFGHIDIQLHDNIHATREGFGRHLFYMALVGQSQASGKYVFNARNHYLFDFQETVVIPDAIPVSVTIPAMRWLDIHFETRNHCADFSHLTIRDSYGRGLSRAFEITFETGGKELEKPPVILDHHGCQCRIDLNRSNMMFCNALGNLKAGTAFFERLNQDGMHSMFPDGKYHVTLV